MSLRQPASSASKIAIRRRQDEAFRLRLAGASLSEIARTLDYKTESAALGAVKRATDRLGDEQREFMVKLHTARLDDLLVRVNRIFLNPGPVVHNGHPVMVTGTDGQARPLEDQRVKLHAVREARHIMESMRRLSGIDAPAKMEVTGEDGGPIEVDAQSSLISRIVARAERQQAIDAASRTVMPDDGAA